MSTFIIHILVSLSMEHSSIYVAQLLFGDQVPAWQGKA